MQHADVVLQDDAIIAAVHQALAHRHPNSRSHGRPGFPAEVVLRLLILKHVRNWSYAVLEREVRANLVYRDFTRVGADKMPDAKTMGRWGIALGPAVITGSARPDRTDRPGQEGGARAQDACRHHGRREQYPLPHR